MLRHVPDQGMHPSCQLRQPNRRPPGPAARHESTHPDRLLLRSRYILFEIIQFCTCRILVAWYNLRMYTTHPARCCVARGAKKQSGCSAARLALRRPLTSDMRVWTEVHTTHGGPAVERKITALSASSG